MNKRNYTFIYFIGYLDETDQTEIDEIMYVITGRKILKKKRILTLFQRMYLHE